MGIVSLLLTNAGILALSALLLWFVSYRIKDVSFIDSWWPLGMVLVACVSYARTKDTGPHALALMALCTIWGARLGGYLFWRWRKQGPDPRYTALLENAQSSRGWGFGRASLLLVFALQAPLQWLVCLPVQLGPVTATFELGFLGWVGIAVGLFGIVFESLSDWQLLKFKTDRANVGRIMDRGLWRFTRHPNFFGEACLWWGLYLIAAEAGVGVWSLPGPVLITLLLTKGSGAPTVEGRMSKRPGYDEYLRRTSSFIPWPPKKN